MVYYFVVFEFMLLLNTQNIHINNHALFLFIFLLQLWILVSIFYYVIWILVSVTFFCKIPYPITIEGESNHTGRFESRNHDDGLFMVLFSGALINMANMTSLEDQRETEYQQSQLSTVRARDN